MSRTDPVRRCEHGTQTRGVSRSRQTSIFCRSDFRQSLTLGGAPSATGHAIRVVPRNDDGEDRTGRSPLVTG